MSKQLNKKIIIKRMKVKRLKVGKPLMKKDRLAMRMIHHSNRIYSHWSSAPLSIHQLISLHKVMRVLLM